MIESPVLTESFQDALKLRSNEMIVRGQMRETAIHVFRILEVVVHDLLNECSVRDIRLSEKCPTRNTARSQAPRSPLVVVNELRSTFETTMADDELLFQ